MEVAGQDRKKNERIKTLRTPSQQEKKTKGQVLCWPSVPPRSSAGSCNSDCQHSKRHFRQSNKKEKKWQNKLKFSKCSLLLVKDCSIIHSIAGLKQKKATKKRKGSNLQISGLIKAYPVPQSSLVESWWLKVGESWAGGRVCDSTACYKAFYTTKVSLFMGQWSVVARCCFVPHFGFTSFGRAGWKPTDGCWIQQVNLWIQRILNPQFSWGVLLFEVNGYDPDLNKSAITATNPSLQMI